MTLRADNKPLEHRSLIQFAIGSSVVYGAIMAVQATHDHMERANLIGDVPAFARFTPLPHPLPARGARV